VRNGTTEVRVPSAVLSDIVWNPLKPELHPDGQPEGGSYKPGDKLTIVAASVSKPAPTVRWIKDGLYLDEHAEGANVSTRRRLGGQDGPLMASCNLLGNTPCNLTRNTSQFKPGEYALSKHTH
jgi:hypothetical protein